MSANTEPANFQEFVAQHEGQKVAVIAARYQYRGTLSKCLPDAIILTNACAVEVSGPSNGERPQTEDPINGTVTIKTDAIEIFYQPRFSQAPLPGEDGWQQGNS